MSGESSKFPAKFAATGERKGGFGATTRSSSGGFGPTTRSSSGFGATTRGSGSFGAASRSPASNFTAASRTGSGFGASRSSFETTPRNVGAGGPVRSSTSFSATSGSGGPYGAATRSSGFGSNTRSSGISGAATRSSGFTSPPKSSTVGVAAATRSSFGATRSGSGVGATTGAGFGAAARTSRGFGATTRSSSSYSVPARFDTTRNVAVRPGRNVGCSKLAGLSFQTTSRVPVCLCVNVCLSDDRASFFSFLLSVYFIQSFDFFLSHHQHRRRRLRGTRQQVSRSAARDPRLDPRRRVGQCQSTRPLDQWQHSPARRLQDDHCPVWLPREPLWALLRASTRERWDGRGWGLGWLPVDQLPQAALRREQQQLRVDR